MNLTFQSNSRGENAVSTKQVEEAKQMLVKWSVQRAIGFYSTAAKKPVNISAKENVKKNTKKPTIQPTYAAIKALGDKKGSSCQAIRRYDVANNKICCFVFGEDL